jgi:hypothetical protein
MKAGEILAAIQHDFARSSQAVLYVIEGSGFPVELISMPRGKVEEALNNRSHGGSCRMVGWRRSTTAALGIGLDDSAG